MNPNDLKDPYRFLRVMWPEVHFYDKQWDIIYSVEETPETFVSAGNMLGKDFLSGFIVVKQAVTNPVCRIVTTSVKDDHLNVLWGEIGRFIETARYPLDSTKGGPLILNHRHLRKVDPVTGVIDHISYVIGMVSAKAEGLAGHHAPYTLGVIDEASGVDNKAYTQMGTWAKHVLAIGNPNPCGREHFFYKGVKGGDLVDDE